MRWGGNAWKNPLGRTRAGPRQRQTQGGSSSSGPSVERRCPRWQLWAVPRCWGRTWQLLTGPSVTALTHPEERLGLAELSSQLLLSLAGLGGGKTGEGKTKEKKKGESSCPMAALGVPTGFNLSSWCSPFPSDGISPSFFSPFPTDHTPSPLAQPEPLPAALPSLLHPWQTGRSSARASLPAR